VEERHSISEEGRQKRGRPELITKTGPRDRKRRSISHRVGENIQTGEGPFFHARNGGHEGADQKDTKLVSGRLRRGSDFNKEGSITGLEGRIG